MATPSALEWLRAGGPWGTAPDMVETHAAFVFLVGDRAYKVKKPVALGYLDFSTLERRRLALERELQRNQRTAPMTYLGLVPIVEHAGALTLGGEGTPVEWVLEMRRFPANALLAHLAAEGALSEPIIERLAAHAAQFHDRLENLRGYDWPTAVVRISQENTQDLRAQAIALGEDAVTRAIAAREGAAAACRSALTQQSGDVRVCHGDMHLGNAFLDGDQPTLFDCIEFDDFYATIPPLYDIAFLLMDLIARDLPRHANRALNVWAISRDPTHWHATMEALATLPLYLALRAEIRAKTEARRPGGAQNAHRYLDLVARLSFRPAARLVAIGGLSGTGKSSLAKALAWRVGGGPGAVHLRSDEIRKRLANIAATERLPESAYTQQATERVYATMFSLVHSALANGTSVIVDAVFAREGERMALQQVARDAGVPFAGLWLEAPRQVLEQRVSKRQGDASDADVAVLKRQLAFDLGSIDWQRVDATANLADLQDSVSTLLGLDAPA